SLRKSPLFVKPSPKSGRSLPRPRTSPRPVMERVVTACSELTARGADPNVLRETLVESARQIFQAPLALVLMSGGSEGPKLGAISSESKEAAGDAGRDGMLAHATSFASQAIAGNQGLNFRFSYHSTEGKKIYCGLAALLRTPRSAAPLLIPREAAFSPPEVAGFRMLAGIARLALDNAELSGLTSTQQKNMDQLLEISSDLGATSRQD